VITESRTVVEFHGGIARSGPLCWGQQGTWDTFERWLPEVKPFFFLTRWLPVPQLLELGDVLEAVGELLLRHESLRTTFAVGPGGEVTQQVLASGTLPVDLYDRPADDPVQFSDIVTTSWQRSTAAAADLAAELPLRVSIALHEGIPVVLTFAVSHLAADYTATEQLVRELTALLAARADGTPPPPARQAAQPLDIALAERTLDGQRRNVDAVLHLRDAMRRMPPAIPARATPESPRFVRADLETDVLPVAIRRASRRCRTSASVVLLAVTAALVRRFCGDPLVRLDVMQSNRAAPELAASVTTLNQVVHTVADLRGDTVGDLVARATRTMADARAHGRYDGRVVREVLRASGRNLVPGVQFNDIWSTLPRTRPRPDEPDPTTTELTWPQVSESEDMVLYLDFRGTPDRIRIVAMADTAVLPRADIEALLLAFEHVATEFATADVPLSRIDHLFPAPGTRPPMPAVTGHNR
jgi:condensation domain-containing protein